MDKPVEVKEFDSIICNKEYADVENFTCINENDFKELETFIYEYAGTEDSADALDFMRVGYKRGVGELVSFRNYVGLIQLKNGFQVQILPKIDFGAEDDIGNKSTKRLFLKMLRSMKDFPSKVFNDASLHVDRMNLYEIFINMYIQEVRQLIKHGLRSSYIEQVDNLNYFKGKLLVGQHVRTNLAHNERFYVAFEEFHQNRPENRIIKATLEKLQKLTTSAANAKEIRQLLVSFEMVESSKAYEKDFMRIQIDRNTKDYENLMAWSRVFLMNKSFTTFSGETTSRALLFPMESVYESYVARNMKKVLGTLGWDVSSQDRGYFLFTKPRRQFALRPDLVLKKDGRTIVMDTKWKRLIPNERQNYGISQADMYQMYAYSKKYDAQEIWLLYPYVPEMKDNMNIFFDSGDGTRVHIRFIDLKDIETDLFRLNCELLSYAGSKDNCGE